MPSTATITAFYTFTQNTKARASQVNTNFNVLRGHIIPIDPNTTTSNDVTYDLGSDEHRWRSGYVKTLDFDRSTSTASATIEADANTNTGEMVFKINGNEKLRLVSGGISVTREVNLAGTSTAAGGIATYATTTKDLTASVDIIFGSTLTLISTGKPLKIGFRGPGNVNPNITFFGLTTTASPSATITVYRDGTTTAVAVFSWSMGLGTDAFIVSLNPFMAYDFSSTAGTHNYIAYARVGTNCDGSIENAALIVHE